MIVSYYEYLNFFEVDSHQFFWHFSTIKLGNLLLLPSFINPTLKNWRNDNIHVTGEISTLFVNVHLTVIVQCSSYFLKFVFFYVLFLTIVQYIVIKVNKKTRQALLFNAHYFIIMITKIVTLGCFVAIAHVG